MPPRSLFGRLLLFLLLGLVAAQALSAWLLLADRGSALYRVLAADNVARIGAIVELLDEMGDDDRERIASALDLPPLRMAVDLPWSELPADRSPPARALADALHERLGDERPLSVSLAEPGHAEAGRAGPPRRASFFIQVGLRDGAVVSFLHELPRTLVQRPDRVLASLAILLVSVVVLAVLAVRALTRPLRTLAHAATELGRDLERPPLAEAGPLEVRAAAQAFNTMQARLRAYLDDRARMLAAVSHDLKTPLTRLRLRAELIDDEAQRTRILADLDEMEAMVQDTLDYMRGVERGEPATRLDLLALIDALADDAADAGTVIAVEGGLRAPVAGRPLALKRCLQNLIDNARAYGGGALHIVVEDGATVVTVRVLDDGPGIPAAELERVFEPFHRLEGSRSRNTGGTGLGLAIARNIARAHGGELSLANRPEGGLEARLTLPR